jgi:type III pantothenate kinase
MLLAVDIGNTNVVLGLFENRALRFSWRLDSLSRRTEDEWLLLLKTLFHNEDLKLANLTDVAISSVVPGLTSSLKALSKKHLNTDPLIITGDMDHGIKIFYESPSSVGGDRICNAVAGYDKFGGPLIIIDFGTATTFDVISETGDYLGGVISPGLETAARHLHKLAAKLPSVELIFPEEIIAKNTERSMQVGIMYGTLASVEGLINKIKEELQSDCKVITTGGIGFLIADMTDNIESHEPDLTLYGIEKIYTRFKNIK